MKVDLRAARPLDATPLARIIMAHVAENAWLPPALGAAETIGQIDAVIARGWVTVACLDGRRVGFSVQNGADLHGLYVASGVRGAGVGARLLDHVKAQAPAELRLWSFAPNEAANRFYRRHGFVEMARGDGAANDHAVPEILFAWTKESA